MGKSSGSAPAAPDPKQLIPVQQAADRDTFNYQTAANRTNTVGPDQSVTWDKKSGFDQTGYDAALKAWQASNPQGRWVPGSAAGTLYGGTDSLYTQGTAGYIDPNQAGQSGHWEGGNSDGAPAPDRAAYNRDTWTQTTQLSPEQQRIHDLSQSSDVGRAGILDALTKRLSDTYGKPVDYSGVSAINKDIIPGGAVQTDAGVKAYQAQLAGLDPAQYNKEAADAVYNAQSGYFNEDQGTKQKALEARLAEQGFVPGTPGYTAAMNDFQDNQNQALNQLRNQSTTQGFSVGNQTFGNKQSSLNSAIAAALSGGKFANDAQSQQFGQNQQRATFGNQSRAQQIAELLQAREQPLNELNAVRSGTQTNTSGQSGGTGGAGGQTNATLNPTDILSQYQNQYKNQMNGYNAGVASDNQDTQTLASIASIAAMFFSDGRLKSDFVNIGETPAGIPVKEYTIDGERQKGVVAQDLIAAGQSKAVYVDPESGLYAVDYSQVE